MRAIVPQKPLGDLAILKVNNRKTAKYLLLTDVSEFYRSLYTHSIPWALHGKAASKAQRRNASMFGNLIDKSLRDSQDQQTNGIPVGPDTSLVVGEIILSAVDRQLSKALKRSKGFRYYDDYELAFRRYSEAEDALAVFQGVLAEYGLQLNPSKTKICDLPQPMESSPWILDIRDFEFKQYRPGSKQRILKFFDLVFDHKNRHKDSYVLAYAISRIEQEIWSEENCHLIQAILFQALSMEPSSIQQFLSAITRFWLMDKKIDETTLNRVLNEVIVEHAPKNQSSEVAWAIWGLVSFGLPIERSSAKAISSIEDSVIALLALDANSRGLIRGKLSTDRWEALMNQDELYRSQWLLAYEASIKGWLPSNGADHVANDPAFSFLKSHNVSYYSRIEKPTLKTIKHLETRKGESYDDTTTSSDESESDVNVTDNDDFEDFADDL